MNKKTEGFILIKIVIAIALLSIVMMVSLRMIGASSAAIRDNRQKTTATFLLQQCLELTRNIRDTAWRQNLPWDCAFEEGVQSLEMDPTGNTQTGNCNIAGGKGLGYILDNTVTTPVAISEMPNYARMIDVTKDAGGESLSLRCTIEWAKKSGTTESLTMSQILTDWKKK